MPYNAGQSHWMPSTSHNSADTARTRRDSLKLDDKADHGSDSHVWRVELGAGKQHLKAWNLRTWDGLDTHFGNVIVASVNAFRHTRPSADTNRSRWPDSELWNRVRQEVTDDPCDISSRADPDRVRRVQKDEHDRFLITQMTGLLVRLAACRSVSEADLAAFAKTTGSEMAQRIGVGPFATRRNWRQRCRGIMLELTRIAASL